MHILLVEDDALIVASLTELLRDEGYDVSVADTQNGAVSAAAELRPDLVLLDVTLKEGNGFAACAAIKAQEPGLPVIFLTASGDEPNTVAGFAMGADDYVAKPFRPRELLARIASVLRRTRRAPQALTFGSLVIDPERAVVTRGGREIVLSALEYRLLLLFASHAGRLVTRERIREALWEEAGAYVEDNTITVYVKRLRDKIEDDPAHPQLIVTARGLGYRAGR